MITGDLLFTQIGSPGNAISAVTEGYRGARVNHVGVIVETNLGTFVLEAFPPEVRLTNLQVFIRRSNDHLENPRYMAARLLQEHLDILPAAISYGLEQRDVPYDSRYLTDEAALYCSELVVDMFKNANNGIPFFPESPMSFRDLETGEVHDYWVRYYDYFGMDVPEGAPGSNPGDISKDDRLHIYDVVGNITGYEA
ncbi:MAG: YiiX/YebB-like N1pC/P60 family cysteine hydrolase [Planctomycetota bacterium]